MNDLLVGAMLVRTLHRPDAPLPEDLAEQIIGAAMGGIGPREA